MRAYKFLTSGAVGPFSGFAWPRPRGGEPADWILPSSEAPPPFRDAVRGCSVEQLAYWVHDDLWEMELDGPITLGLRELSGTRGRLVGPVGAWDAHVAVAYVADCVERWQPATEGAQDPRARGYARQVAKLALKGPAGAGFAAAHTAGVLAASAGAGYRAAAAAERRRQSSWIATALGIDIAAG